MLYTFIVDALQLKCNMKGKKKRSTYTTFFRLVCVCVCVGYTNEALALTHMCSETDVTIGCAYVHVHVVE